VQSAADDQVWVFVGARFVDRTCVCARCSEAEINKGFDIIEQALPILDDAMQK
jgi:hypothetical protein